MNINLKATTLELNNWAVVGASNKENTFGYKIVKILKENGYTVFPVNPKSKQIAGLDCFSSLAEIEEEVEVVDLVVNPQIGIQVLEEIARLGIDYAWLQPGARSNELRNYASKQGVSLIEDCIYATLK